MYNAVQKYVEEVEYDLSLTFELRLFCICLIFFLDFSNEQTILFLAGKQLSHYFIFDSWQCHREKTDD